MLTGRTSVSDGKQADNVRTGRFKEQLNLLPTHIQEAAQSAFDAFVKNPNDPTLNRHELDDTKTGRHRNGSFAVSVTRRYRAIYVDDHGTHVWYWIGSHEDYNNFAGR